MKKSIVACLLLLVQIGTSAQITNHYGVFPTIDHSGTLSNRLGYSLYYFGALNLMNRRPGGLKGPAEFFVFYSEQALTYKVSNGFSLAASYVYERQRPMGDNYRNEHRFYLQGTYTYNLGNTAVKHRLRFDGRFIGDRSTGEFPYTHRVRYLFGVSTPIHKEHNRWYVSAYNEFFFNTSSNSRVIYAEDWAFAGIGYKTRSAGNIEAGPLYMFWLINGGRAFMTNFYYLQLTWSTHIDFRRSAKGQSTK